jgi:hypothetical protein
MTTGILPENISLPGRHICRAADFYTFFCEEPRLYLLELLPSRNPLFPNVKTVIYLLP